MKTKTQPEKNLFSLIQIYTVISVIILLACVIFIIIDSSLYKTNVCFETQCIKRFFTEVKPIVPITEFLMKMLLSMTTIFGIYYALKNYLNTTNTSRISVHLTHMNTFKEYVLAEIENEPRINKKSIDILKWYNSAFPESRKGSLDVGKEYISKINILNAEIEESNNISTGTTIKAFKYQEHQDRIIKKLAQLGIHVNRMPKKDFFDVEEEIFELINKVNKELCLLNIEYRLKFRKYT
ncbi:retron Ec48 family effector membrane protein [Shewanella marisflavi]|uniref:retron Ec48 family effector membrane protein n=1 Tax=Shewanella marisflavi TaxID=260364 RepID=UPI003AAA271E